MTHPLAGTRLALLGAALLGGCVHVYQPVAGLQAPVIVDINAPNLSGVAVNLRCHPGELLNRQEAGTLCVKVGRMLEHQGAEVVLGDDALAEGDAASAAATRLIVDLSARELESSNDPLGWVAFGLTCGVLPAASATTFAQDVVIRDAAGFLLAQTSLHGRMVRYVGLGSWAGNALLNLAWREPDERVLPETASEDLSADLYGQISQLVYNARVQSELLQATGGAR